MLLSRRGLRLRSLGMALGGVVVAIVVFIDGLEMMVRSGDMPRGSQVMVVAVTSSSSIVWEK